jgi:hypothetical protein
LNCIVTAPEYQKKIGKDETPESHARNDGRNES